MKKTVESDSLRSWVSTQISETFSRSKQPEGVVIWFDPDRELKVDLEEWD